MPKTFTEWFLRSQTFEKLNDTWDIDCISDEEFLGYGNIYWRLVRPNKKDDIGPLHRDEWFWHLNKDYPKLGPKYRRLKVWIAIEVEPTLNGLRVEPFSHKRTDIEYIGETRHGIIKPVLLNQVTDFECILVPCNPGDMIIFHDQLIHGGALNRGIHTRISVEFTLIISI